MHNIIKEEAMNPGVYALNIFKPQELRETSWTVFFLGILPRGGKIEHRNFMGGQSY